MLLTFPGSSSVKLALCQYHISSWDELLKLIHCNGPRFHSLYGMEVDVSILFLSVLLRSGHFQSVTNTKRLRPDVQIIPASIFHKSSGDGQSGRLSPWMGQRSRGMPVLTTSSQGFLPLCTVIPDTCSSTQKHILPAHIRACVYTETHTTSTQKCTSTFRVLINHTHQGPRDKNREEGQHFKRMIFQKIIKFKTSPPPASILKLLEKCRLVHVLHSARMDGWECAVLRTWNPTVGGFCVGRRVVSLLCSSPCRSWCAPEFQCMFLLLGPDARITNDSSAYTHAHLH